MPKTLTMSVFKKTFTFISMSTLAFAAGIFFNATTAYATPPSEPGTYVNALNVDSGGQGVGYNNVAFYSDHITFGNSSQWANYTISVSATGYYDICTDVATGEPGVSIAFRVDGAELTGPIHVPEQEFGSYHNVCKYTNYLTSGTHVIQVYAPAGNSDFKGFLISNPPSPTTYYVSYSTGNDSNNGTSTATAWKTFTPVNVLFNSDNHGLHPGDTILFKRGDVWPGGTANAIGIMYSGTPANPIVYDAYGSGAKPKFLNSVPLVNANFTSLGGGVYSIPTEISGLFPNAIFVNGTFLVGIGTSTLTANGQWRFENATSGVVDIMSATDPRSDGKTYAVTYDYGSNYFGTINSDGQSYVTFNNLVTDQSTFAGFYVNGSTGVTLNNDEAYNSGQFAFAVKNSTGFTGNTLWAAYMRPSQSGTVVAYASYSDVNGMDNETSVWTDSTADHLEDTSQPAGTAYYEGITTFGPKSGSVTFNNISTHNGRGFLDNSASNATVVVNGGLFDNARLELYGHDMMVKDIYMEGPLAYVSFIGDYNSLLSSVIAGQNLGNLDYKSSVISHGNWNTVALNTIVTDANAPAYDSAVAMSGPDQHLFLGGNILISNGNLVKQWSGNFSSTTFSNSNGNYFSTGGAFEDDAGAKTLSQFKALGGWDANSFEGGPNPFNIHSMISYDIDDTGPLFNGSAGVIDVSGSVSLDAAGRPRKAGPTYDIGAMEYPSSSTVPNIYSPLTAGCTTTANCKYQVSANNSPTSFSATGLPSGLSLNTSTGLISGTTTASAGNYSVALHATNASGSGNATATIAVWTTANYPFDGVHAAPIAGTIQASQIDQGGAEVAYHGAAPFIGGVTMSNSGYWTKYTVNVATSSNFNLTAVGEAYASNESIKLILDGADITPDLSLPFNGFANATTTRNNIYFPAGIHTLELYTSTGGLQVSTLSFATTSIPNVPADTIQAVNVDPGGQGVGYNGVGIGVDGIAFSQPGQWANYTVNVATSSNYDLSASVATGADNETVQFKVDGTAVTGNLPIPNNGWDTYTNVTRSGISLSAGTHVIQVYTANGGFNFQSFHFTQTALPTFPGTIISAQNVDYGGEGVGYHGIGFGDTLINYSQAGYWANYTVNVTATSTYILRAAVQTGVNNETIQFLVDSTAVTDNINIPNTNWVSVSNISKSGISLGAGKHVIQAYSATGGFNLISFTFATSTLTPSIPGTQINAVDVDPGGSGVGYSGVTFASSSISYGGANQWANYTANLPVSGSYDLTASIASASSGKTFIIKVDGTTVTSPISVTNTGSAGTFANVTQNSIALTSGNHVIQVFSSTGGFNLATLFFATSSTPHIPSDTIQAVNYDAGGSGVGYSGITTNATSTTYTAASQWANYTAIVSTTGYYDLTASIASASSGKTFIIKVDGATTTSAIAVTNTGSASNFTNVTQTLISLTAGTHVIQVFSSTGGFTLANFSFAASAFPSIPSHYILGTSVDSGGSGVGYSGVTITATSTNFTAANQWANYTVTVSSAGNYDLFASTSAAATGKTFVLKLDGVTTTPAISIANTGSLNTFAGTTTRTGIPLPAGTHTIQWTTSTGGFDLGFFRFTATPVPSIPTTTIQAINVDYGGEGVSSHNATVGLSSTNFGTTTGAWANYTISIPTSRIYDLTANAASGTSNTNMRIKVDGVFITPNIVVTNTGSLSNFGNNTRTGVPLPSGTHTIQVYANTGNFSLATLAFANTPIITFPATTMQAINVDYGGDVNITQATSSVGFMTSTSTATYTANFSTTKSYTISLRAGTIATGKDIKFKVDGVDVAGTISLPNTGSYTTFQTVTKTGVSVTAGVHTVQVYTSTGGFYVNTFQFQ